MEVVGIFDANFRQLFDKAIPIKATVKEESKLMTHPVETGASITDHKVVLPVEIELSLIITGKDFKSVYERIKQTYLAGTSLSVQTRTGVYNNQVIQSIPHDEDTTMVDAVTIAMKLSEVIYVTAQYDKLPPRKVKHKEKSSTVDRGEQQPQKSKRQSLLHEWLN